MQGFLDLPQLGLAAGKSQRHGRIPRLFFRESCKMGGGCLWFVGIDKNLRQILPCLGILRIQFHRPDFAVCAGF